VRLSGVERSSVFNAYSRAGTGWERTPWHATQRAAPALDECGHHVAPMADWRRSWTILRFRPSLLSVMLASEAAL
jgi:hypothetical protein